MGKKIRKEADFMTADHPSGVAFSTPRDRPVDCFASQLGQVKKDYNTGAVYFGPLEGSP